MHTFVRVVGVGERDCKGFCIVSCGELWHRQTHPWSCRFDSRSGRTFPRRDSLPAGTLASNMHTRADPGRLDTMSSNRADISRTVTRCGRNRQDTVQVVAPWALRFQYGISLLHLANKIVQANTPPRPGSAHIVPVDFYSLKNEMSIEFPLRITHPILVWSWRFLK